MSLKEEVEQWLEDQAEEDQKVSLEDLQRGGCASGMIGFLCYYSDTVQFYEENQSEINSMLSEASENAGELVLVHFKGYDKEDPLCLEQNNQNMLAWWGFEEAAFNIYTEKYEQ